MSSTSNNDKKGKAGKSDKISRAVILPTISPASEPVRAATRSARRKAAEETITAVMVDGFKQTDRQLSSTGGRRITQEPNRLGFIHITAPAASIYALAGQDWVKAIIEDQPAALQ
jgi:hypothetical protein